MNRKKLSYLCLFTVLALPINLAWSDIMSNGECALVIGGKKNTYPNIELIKFHWKTDQHNKTQVFTDANSSYIMAGINDGDDVQSNVEINPGQANKINVHSIKVNLQDPPFNTDGKTRFAEISFPERYQPDLPFTIYTISKAGGRPNGSATYTVTGGFCELGDWVLTRTGEDATMRKRRRIYSIRPDHSRE
ncbi:MAG: hypothetical protein K0R94_1282 [Burkholderiales bacterium]|jgi:hypothetical protein|nr:hypothetical protein [Burkholderiales bacterium]